MSTDGRLQTATGNKVWSKSGLGCPCKKIDATDRQIDRLVYDLYGLTEEEIRIVEEGTTT